MAVQQAASKTPENSPFLAQQRCLSRLFTFFTPPPGGAPARDEAAAKNNYARSSSPTTTFSPGKPLEIAGFPVDFPWVLFHSAGAAAFPNRSV
jgi:hypothetical protein